MGFLRLFWEAGMHWYRQEAATLAAALAYLTPFVLVPLLVFSVGTVSWLVGPGRFTETLIAWGIRLAPDITELLLEATANFDIATVGFGLPWFGYIFFLWVVVYTFNTLASSLQRIWHSSGSGWRVFAGNAVRSLVFFLSLQAYLVSLMIMYGLTLALPLTSLGQQIIETVGVFLLTVTLFYGMFTILGRRTLHWTSRLTGALVVAVSFLFLRWLVTWWIASTPAVDLFGAAGLILGLLIWVYLTAVCIFYGAAFAWVFEQQRTARWY